jgi:hypothetical protein
MSFADSRNVLNAMDQVPHSAVTLDSKTSSDLANEALLPATPFDFERYPFKTLSLLQHIAIYLRMKARDQQSCSAPCIVDSCSCDAMCSSINSSGTGSSNFPQQN